MARPPLPEGRGMLTTIVILALLGFIAVWIYNRASGGRIEKGVDSMVERVENAGTPEALTAMAAGEGVAEFRVSAPSGDILGRVRSFLTSPAWGVRGEEIGLLQHNTVQFQIDPGYRKFELLAWIAVSVLTLGSGLVAWIIYHFLIRSALLPVVEVGAYPTETEGVSRVFVAGPERYRDPLEGFVASLPGATRGARP
jgi:hypothetical protein